MDYNDIKKVAADAAGSIKDTSVRLYKTAKISMDISKRLNAVDEKLQEIGRLVYKAHCGKETDENIVPNLCREIDEMISDINSLREKKDSLKAHKKCEVCGSFVNPEDEACPNCGCEIE